PGIAAPRFGAGCPLWPLYRALARPLSPETTMLEMPDGSRFTVWAISHPAGPPGAAGHPRLQATMLIRPTDAPGDAAEPVGPACALCPREGCAARRAPNQLA
ncbi:DUF2083 domain-containing protein, partial [Rhodobacterales bacterium HKCCE3408]|nr:DUF2083 domain-containing protein [Rhodobacterales bacterium HKCCE3408]